VFFVVKKLQNIPQRAVSYVKGRTVSTPPRNIMVRYEDAKIQERTERRFDSDPSMHLVVKDQSRSIGKRNIHTLKAGSRYSVGGKKSDFLIFLVSLPNHLGEIRFDG
jgi:hypothetical protein